MLIDNRYIYPYKLLQRTIFNFDAGKRDNEFYGTYYNLNFETKERQFCFVDIDRKVEAVRRINERYSNLEINCFRYDKWLIPRELLRGSFIQIVDTTVIFITFMDYNLKDSIRLYFNNSTETELVFRELVNFIV